MGIFSGKPINYRSSQVSAAKTGLGKAMAKKRVGAVMGKQGPMSVGPAYIKPKAKPQLSQRDTYGKAMLSAMKNSKNKGKGVGF